jgi:hypothetical protein
MTVSKYRKTGTSLQIYWDEISVGLKKNGIHK